MIKGPYKLPEGWHWVQLWEIAEKPQYGYTSSSLPETVGPKFLRITDITSGAIDWDSVPHCKIDAEAFKKYQLKPGDLLFARSGSIGATILIREVPCEAVFASYLLRVRLRAEALPEFLSLILKAPFCQKQFIPLGAAQKNINAKAVQQILIPLPPIDEQRRIVARVEELMARVREAKRLRQQAKEDAERLMQAALAEVFPRPGTEPPTGWRWVRLGEVCEIIMGQSPPSTTYNTEGEGLPFFQGKADFGELQPTPRVWCRAPQKIAEVGDILISVRAPVGPTNLVREKCCIGRGLAALRPKGPVETMWLLYHLRSVEDELATRGSGSTFNAITKRQLDNLEIPLPPLADQRRIVTHLEAVQEKVKALKEAQAAIDAELQRLEQAILDRAFRGEL